MHGKKRYFLELPGFDVYDEKTLLQWTFFGLPMYSVKTGISAAAVSPSPWLPAGAAVERKAGLSACPTIWSSFR